MDRRCLIRADNFPNVCYTKLCELSGRTLRVIQSDTDNLSHHFLCEPIAEALEPAGKEISDAGDPG